MAFLGVDFGAKSVGVARSDETGRIALPIGVFQNDAKLLRNVVEFVQEHGISEIVIGESKDFQGRDNRIMEKIRAFADILERELSLPIHFEPEFLTSAEARRAPAGGIGGDSGEKRVDASAAAIILQSFLDKRANHE